MVHNLKNMSLRSKIKNDAGLLGLLILSSAFIFFTHLSNFSLSIDEELASLSPDSSLVWISQGRWGMAVINSLLPNASAVPFISTVLICVALPLAALILSYSQTQNISERAAYSVMFIISPIWLHIVEFNTLASGAAAGLVATSYGAYILQKKGGYGQALISGLFVGFAVGIYQAFIVLYAMTCLTYVFPRSHFWPFEKRLDKQPFISRTVDAALSTITALLFYLLMRSFFLRITHTNETYTDEWLQIGEFVHQPVPTLLRIGHQIAGILCGTDPTYLGWGWAVLLLPAIGTTLGLITTFKNFSREPGTSVMSLFSLAIAVLVASALIVMASGRIPTRALIGFPILFSWLSLNAWRRIGGRLEGVKWAALIYATIVAGWIGASLFYSDRVARERDALLGHEIASAINELDLSAFKQPIPFTVVGEHTFDHTGVARQVQIFGTSFFEQDGGNPYRIAAYLRYLGVEGLVPVPVNYLERAHVDIREIPSWPKPGSVSIVKGMLILKFGEPSYQQSLQLNKTSG